MISTVIVRRKVFRSLLAFSICGCATVSSPFLGDGIDVDVESGATTHMDAELQKESEALYQFVTGELAYLDNDYEDALNRFARASSLSDDISPTLHGKLAELFVRSGELDKALSESQKLLEHDPENTEFLTLHAGILESNGEFQEAANIYQDILAQDSERRDVAILLANVYARQKRLDDAALVLRKFEKRDEADVLVVFNLGRIYEFQGEKSKSLSYYLKAFEYEPRSPLVVGDVLRLQLEKGDTDAAVDFSKRVLDIQPDNVLARKVLSQLLIKGQNTPEAIEQLEILEKMDEAVGNDTRFKLALLYMETQNYKEALQQLLLILASEPENDEARFYLASLYAGTDRVEEALAELEKIKPEQAMYVKANTFSAFLWRQVGNLEKAQKSILAAYDADDTDLKVIYYTVVILQDNGQLKRAEDVLEDALNRYPDHERLRYHYGVLLHDMGKRERSLEQMQLVVEQNPKSSDALNFIAYSYAEQNEKLEEAVKLVLRALKEKPDDPYYLDTLGWTYFKLGDLKKAAAAFKKAVEKLPMDPVVLEHYADVMSAQDKKLEAVNYYKRSYKILQTYEARDEQSESRLKNKIDKIESVQKESGLLQVIDSETSNM